MLARDNREAITDDAKGFQFEARSVGLGEAVQGANADLVNGSLVAGLFDDPDLVGKLCPDALLQSQRTVTTEEASDLGEYTFRVFLRVGWQLFRRAGGRLSCSAR